MKTIPTVPVTDIPEVEEYLKAEKKLEDWLEQNRANLDPLRALMEEVDTKRQAADKIVKARGVFCGPWKKHRIISKIDVDKLVDAIGVDKFLNIGGTKATMVVYNIPENKMEIAVASGHIDKDLAETVWTQTPAYRAPKEPKL